MTLKDLGISRPVLVNPMRVYEVEVLDPNADLEAAPRRDGHAGAGPASMGMGGMEDARQRPATPPAPAW